MEALSARRRHVLGIIVPEVVPSTYGDAKFKRIDSKWKPGAGYTTCGGLPSHVANQLGVTEKCKAQGILGSGLASMRDAAMMQNAWVHNDLTRLSANDGGAKADPFLSMGRSITIKNGSIIFGVGE